MSKVQVHNGVEYETQHGQLYYIVANNVYEPYFGQYDLDSGKVTEGVAVVTGSYISTPDGIVPINITSQQQTSGVTTGAGTNLQVNAELNRLSKLVASLQQENVALRQQVTHQQVMTPVGIAAQQMAQELVTPTVDPFTDELEAAAAAGARQAA